MKKTILVLQLLAVSFWAQAQFTASEQLDINNVNAGFLVHGDMFWNPTTGNANYEFPKGSGKHCGFASALWVGGYNQSTNNLHIAAQTYRQRGNDYWPGPLNETTGASDTIIAADWAQIWKVNASTIDSFISVSNHTINNTHYSILEWPGKGNIYSKTPNNTTLNIPNRNMAFFIDVNNDGIYNPLDGDYPDIKGEQMLWWIFNDNSAAHLETGSLPLKIEIHSSAYACRQVGLENTIFVNYLIYNKGTSIFDSTVISYRSDIDIGYAFDDYTGFDSTYRMGVIYNGDNFDETISGYGNALTQKGCVLLKSPFDVGANREPLGNYTYYNNTAGRTGNPDTVKDFYGYMTGTWLDGSYFVQGCDPEATSGPLIPSKYVFQDDPSNTNGVSEVACNTTPNDRRFIMSSKAFTLLPNAQPIEFTFAFINTDTGVDNSNFNELRRLADSAYTYVNACSGPTFATGLPSIEENNIQLYPNPAHDYIMIKDAAQGQKTARLYSVSGQVLQEKTFSSQEQKMSTAQYAPGIYFLELIKNDKQLIKKFSVE